MFNNCSNCGHGIEHEKFIECSIKDEIKNSYIEWYDGCPYFESKTQFFLHLLQKNDLKSNILQK
jgi:hypothetical protein